jgi:hypothetical protein
MSPCKFSFSQRLEKFYRNVFEEGKTVLYASKKYRIKYTVARILASEYLENNGPAVEERTNSHLGL